MRARSRFSPVEKRQAGQHRVTAVAHVSNLIYIHVLTARDTMQLDSRSDVTTVPEIASVSVLLILVINWKLVRSDLD